MGKIIPKHVTWLPQLLFLYKLRLEYKDNKIAVCHISKNRNMIFKKKYKDVFDLSELERYGFSKDLFGRNLAEHKCVATGKYAFGIRPVSREVVFVLKDGRKIAFESANFFHGQLHELVIHIKENTGILPTGTLGVSLLTTGFTGEKIDYVYDEFSFPKKKLQDVEFKVLNTYFTEEAVVIYKSGQVAYIPYNKLQAVSFFAKTRGRLEPLVMHSGFSCCYWLKNGEKYFCMVNSVEDFDNISAYIKQKHPDIEADSDLIYEGILF